MLSSQTGRLHCVDIKHMKTDTCINSTLLLEGTGLVGSSQEDNTGKGMLLIGCVWLTGHCNHPVLHWLLFCFVFPSCTPKDAGLPISRIWEATLGNSFTYKAWVFRLKQACAPPLAVAFTGRKAWRKFLRFSEPHPLVYKRDCSHRDILRIKFIEEKKRVAN